VSTSSKPSLQPLFDELNKLHFHGKLPRYRVRRRPVPADFNKLLGARVGLTIHELKRIRILSSVTEESALRRIMLHEMCHVACPDGPRIHGPCFMACLRRVAQVEPILATELADYDESLPVPLHQPGIPRTAVLWGAIGDLARSGRKWHWSTVRRTLAEKLDIYEAGFDEEFPDARVEWTSAVTRERENRAAWRAIREAGQGTKEAL
jgi:hypothetical protein